MAKFDYDVIDHESDLLRKFSFFVFPHLHSEIKIQKITYGSFYGSFWLMVAFMLDFDQFWL